MWGGGCEGKDRLERKRNMGEGEGTPIILCAGRP